jgi:hypothetical protein
VDEQQKKELKFKVGDLVVLSAAGEKNYGNSSAFNEILIITRIRNGRDFPIGALRVRDLRGIHFKEYELKFAKAPPKK